MNHGAGAADCLAIDAECVRDRGRLAVGLGALESESDMVDGGAMAVFQTVAAPLTVIVHAQFIAPVADEGSAARGRTRARIGDAAIVVNGTAIGKSSPTD